MENFSKKINRKHFEKMMKILIILFLVICSQAIASNLTDMIQVTSGRFHTCGITKTRGVVCWGDNRSAQLGIPEYEYESSNIPIKVKNVEGAVSVVVGDEHTCALLDTGRVKCWGANSREIVRYSASVGTIVGILGNQGDKYADRNPTEVKGIDAISISASEFLTCVALRSGKVKCWGDYYPSWQGFVENIDNAVSVSVGASYGCAIQKTGKVSCWGVRSSNYADRSEGGRFPDFYDRFKASEVPEIKNAKAISVGLDTSCAVVDTGGVRCWGNHYTVEFKYDKEAYRYDRRVIGPPVSVKGFTNATAISSGPSGQNSYPDSAETCALAKGQLFCWNYWSYNKAYNPTVVYKIGNISTVSVGDGYTCIVLASSEVSCWGDNYYNQLGKGTPTVRLTPVDGPNLRGVIDLKTGYGKTCAVLFNGQVACWGMLCSNSEFNTMFNNCKTYDNPVSKLSIGNPIPNYTIVPGIDDALAVSVNETQCALSRTGKIKCWQYVSEYFNPQIVVKSVDVQGITNAISIAGGTSHQCALLATGKIQCWGNNIFGQLGDGTFKDSSAPVFVAGISNAVSISSNAYTSCALLKTGQVQCWGSRSFLVQGSKSSVPVIVPEIYNAINISVGYDHACAVIKTGRIRCWGYIEDGKLGDGYDSHVMWGPEYGDLLLLKGPQIAHDVIGITNAISVSAGSDYTCAVLSDGQSRCWGYNSNGQLGNNTTETAWYPVQPLGLPSITAISAGSTHTCAIVSGTGAVKCWGYSLNNILGNGDFFTSSILPTRVQNTAVTLTNVKVEGDSYPYITGSLVQLTNGKITNGFGQVSTDGVKDTILVPRDISFKLTSLTGKCEVSSPPSIFEFTRSDLVLPSFKISSVSGVPNQPILVMGRVLLRTTNFRDEIPVKNLSIDGGELGSTKTDERGFYLFDTAQCGRTYNIIPSRYGSNGEIYKFDKTLKENSNLFGQRTYDQFGNNHVSFYADIIQR